MRKALLGILLSFAIISAPAFAESYIYNLTGTSSPYGISAFHKFGVQINTNSSLQKAIANVSQDTTFLNNTFCSIYNQTSNITFLVNGTVNTSLSNSTCIFTSPLQLAPNEWYFIVLFGGLNRTINTSFVANASSNLGFNITGGVFFDTSWHNDAKPSIASQIFSVASIGLQDMISSVLHLYLNDTEEDKSYYFGQKINATGIVSVPSDGVGNLYRNGTIVRQLNFDFEYINLTSCSGGQCMPSNWTNSSPSCGTAYNRTDDVLTGTSSLYLASTCGNIGDKGIANSTPFIYTGNITIWIKSGSGLSVGVYGYGLILNGNVINYYNSSPANYNWFSMTISNNTLMGQTVSLFLEGGPSCTGEQCHTGELFDNITMLNSNGVEITTLPVGVYNYSFNYSGNGSYNPSEVSYIVRVLPLPPTPTPVSSPGNLAQVLGIPTNSTMLWIFILFFLFIGMGIGYWRKNK